MIKLAFKNYLVSLKYVFITLGTIFLGLLIGLSISATIMQSALDTALDSFTHLNEIFVDNLVGLDDFFETIANDFSSKALNVDNALLSKEYYIDVFERTMTAAGVPFEAYLDGLTEIITVLFSSLMVSIIIVFVLQLVGFIFGFYFTNKAIRGGLGIKRVWWKAILIPVISYTLIALIFMGVGYVTTKSKVGGVATLVVALILIELGQMLVAFIEQDDDTTTIKDVFNIKNLFTYNISSIIYIALFAITMIIIYFALGILVTIYFGLSLFTVLFGLLSLNCTSYLSELKKKRKLEEAPVENEKV